MLLPAECKGLRKPAAGAVEPLLAPFSLLLFFSRSRVKKKGKNKNDPMGCVKLPSCLAGCLEIAPPPFSPPLSLSPARLLTNTGNYCFKKKRERNEGGGILSEHHSSWRSLEGGAASL